jgi:O-antigen ligase
MQITTQKQWTNPTGFPQGALIVCGLLGISIIVFVSFVLQSQLISILVAAVLLLVAVCLIIAKRPNYAFLALILLLPFHPLAMSLLVTYSGASDIALKAFAAWKEVVVLVAFSAVLIRQLYSKAKFELTLPDWLAILYLFTICVLSLGIPGLYQVREPLQIKLYGIRDAGFFIVVYFTGRFVPLFDKDLGKVLRTLYGLGIFSAVVGFFEYLFLPVEVLLIVGYVNYNNWLGVQFTGEKGLPENLYVELGGVLFRRMFSIFLMSNVYAQCLVLIIPAIAYIRATSSRRKASTLALGIMLIALFLTITRASIAACITSLFIVGYLLRDKFTRRLTGAIAGALVIGALGVLLYHPALGVVTTSDTSIESHLELWADSVKAIVDSPIIGLGAGTSGFASTRDMVNGRENSWGGESQYFVIGVQFGLLVLALHLGFIVAVLRQSLAAFRRQSEWGRRGICLLAFAGGVGVAMNAANTGEWAVTFPTFVFWWIAGMSVQMASESKPEAAEESVLP